jgi:site-specific recombinase XerD
LRELQTLLGHKSIRTTEIYLKSLVPETVRPNERAILADAK